jgi:hypothetical protein
LIFSKCMFRLSADNPSQLLKSEDLAERGK